MTLRPLFPVTQQFQNKNGSNLVGGKIYVYYKNRTALAEIFSDEEGTVVRTNPVLLDNNGRATVFADTIYSYTIVVCDYYGKELFSQDITLHDAISTAKDVIVMGSNGSVKVDTTTLPNGVQYDLSVNTDIIATKESVDKVKTDLNTLTGTVNNHTTQIGQIQEDINGIESTVVNKKDKQTELNFNGSATKTIKSITQNTNGEINVEYEDIDLPQEVPNVEITSEDKSIKVSETTDVQTNTKKFDLSVQDGGTTYSAGDAIDLTNDTISVKYGKGLEITTDNKLQLKVGKGLTIDNDTLELTIKDLETSITDFRDGDVIPVDGPSGIAKMSKDDLLRETAENARNGMVIEKVYEHNGVSASNYVVSNTTEIRGVCAPFKANTFDKIKLKVQCAKSTTLAVSIMDTSFNVLKSKSVYVEGTSEPYDVMIDWGEVITMNSSFYLDVQVPFNTDNTFLNAREFNYNVCDNYVNPAYIYIKVSTNRFESRYNSVNCEFLLSTGDVRIPNLVDTEPQRIQNLAPVMNPPIIYTAVQDLNNVRNYGVNVYPDHCFNTETMPNVKNDGLDHKYIRSKFGKNPHTGASYVQANDYEEENLSIDFVGENKKVTITTKHISLKASVQNGKKAFVLVIGDSQGMYGGGKLGYANGDGTAFWMYTAKLFDMDKADGATSDVIFLGSEKFRSWDNVAKNEMTYEYLGKERTIHAASESIGSWSINHFLHKATEYTFAGSKDANEVYTGSNPINPFYDYARVNEFDIFSINKWLERFRTLDDDGNRLTWGDPRIGTLISESSLKFINVCKPTHVICMLGRNTVVAPDAYGSVCDDFISAVKRDCPSAKIAMCLQPDMPGTFNGSNYPEVLAPSEATTIYKLNERANQFAIMRAIYNQCKERENDNVFIVPVWFSQPTMYGWNLSSITDFTMENKEKYVIQGDDFHPSGEAHKAWAYQLYCWVLHTMYIDSLNQ